MQALKQDWRTPGTVILCGGIIVTLSMGIRHAFGLFLQPMSADFGWGREVFSLAIALQNLAWGAAQPFTGFVADRYGAGRVLVAGALLYVLGLVLMAASTTGLALAGSAGLLIGLGLSGTTFSVVYGVIGRTVSPREAQYRARHRRCRWFVWAVHDGAGGTDADQQSGLGVGAARDGGARCDDGAAFFRAGGKALRPCRRGSPANRRPGDRRSSAASWVLAAHAGFLRVRVPGRLIASHLPAYLADQGQPARVGMLALALVGLFNIFGTYGAGVLGGRYTKKYLLSALYVARAIVIAIFIALPVTPLSAALFAAAMGLLWLSTVPLTNGIIAQVFGVQYLSMLSGFVFFGHQIGSFLGAWLGGYLFDATGSYHVVWILCIGLALV